MKVQYQTMAELARDTLLIGAKEKTLRSCRLFKILSFTIFQYVVNFWINII